ncbi:MAG TPA: DUF4332 domain-containing protein, partial [Candidatus Thermoplasmatota archaeon]|nr:DUF4332 domain-containing protein [Candidatus Thermoplasmatota archaeon]
MTAKASKAARPAPAAKPSRTSPKPSSGAGHVDILQLEGVGPVHAKQLRKAGVKSSEALIAADPKALAAKTTIAEGLIRTWRSMATLLPVKGVGPQYAEVLARTGIESLVDLANCDADKLTARIEALLESKQVTIVGTKVTEKRVASWIAAAQKLAEPASAATPPKHRKDAKPGKAAKRAAPGGHVDILQLEGVGPVHA